MEENVSVAVLAQKLDDHLRGCERQGVSTNSRLGRIENVLIAVASTAILQLLGLVGVLAGVIFLHPK